MIGAIALAHGDDPRLRTLAPYQLRTLEAIAACGTPACGLHVERCDHCGDQRMVPNTCGNRSCPHCQAGERAAWVSARAGELLPCGYFHAVLTLPPDLRGLAAAFPRVVLDALTRAAGDAIDHLCRDPRHLGGEVGQCLVLHTWKRDLGWHPHVHAIVTAGGWDARRQRWIPARRCGRARMAFLLPVAALRAAFQRRLRRLLLDAHADGAFADGPDLAEIRTLAKLRMHLDRSVARPWVIRIEPPFGGPLALLKYLGAYVNRVAISPRRILAHDRAAGTVTYGWATNREPDRPQRATLDAVDFLRRFAQHILPPRFQRIRFRGLWSTAHRRTKLDVVRRALAAPPVEPPARSQPRDPDPCPICRVGHYHRVPGPCPRPPPALRRSVLRQLRSILRATTPMPEAATISA